MSSIFKTAPHLPPPRPSRRSQPPRASFSLDAIVLDRFRKMLRFKRALVAMGYIREGDMWDLTDRDAVDELVLLVEMDENREERMALLSTRDSLTASVFGRTSSMASSRSACSSRASTAMTSKPTLLRSSWWASSATDIESGRKNSGHASVPESRA